MTEQLFDSDIIEDDVYHPVSVYNLSVCLKEDLDFNLKDC